MKKILITGATGLLGRAVFAEFKKQNWEVVGLCYLRTREGHIRVDLNDTEAVHDLVLNVKPDVIIHCAAERSPDKIEKDYRASRKLNVESSKNLAECANEVGSAFVYISTDYVFDGTNPPYSEDDVPNPLNRYGISKYEGEKEVMNACKDSIILRIPVLYGDEEYLGESAVSSLINYLLDERTTSISNYEIRFPSHTEDIATICFQLVEKRLKDPSIKHVYHWCGSEALTKFDMIRIIADEYHRAHTHIVADNNPSSGAPRPKNTQLSCNRLNDLKIGQHTKFSEGVAKSFKKFIQARV